MKQEDFQNRTTDDLSMKSTKRHMWNQIQAQTNPQPVTRWNFSFVSRLASASVATILIIVVTAMSPFSQNTNLAYADFTLMINESKSGKTSFTLESSEDIPVSEIAKHFTVKSEKGSYIDFEVAKVKKAQYEITFIEEPEPETAYTLSIDSDLKEDDVDEQTRTKTLVNNVDDDYIWEFKQERSPVQTIAITPDVITPEVNSLTNEDEVQEKDEFNETISIIAESKNQENEDDLAADKDLAAVTIDENPNISETLPTKETLEAKEVYIPTLTITQTPIKPAVGDKKPKPVSPVLPPKESLNDVKDEVMDSDLFFGDEPISIPPSTVIDLPNQTVDPVEGSQNEVLPTKELPSGELEPVKTEDSIEIDSSIDATVFGTSAELDVNDRQRTQTSVKPEHFTMAFCEVPTLEDLLLKEHVLVEAAFKASASNKLFLVKEKGMLYGLGDALRVYLTKGASFESTGNENTVWVRTGSVVISDGDRGTYYVQSGGRVADVGNDATFYYAEGADIESYGSGATFFECQSWL